MRAPWTLTQKCKSDTYLHEEDVRHIELPDLVLAAELGRLTEELLDLSVFVQENK
jgi:hypothetical protein